MLYLLVGSRKGNKTGRSRISISDIATWWSQKSNLHVGRRNKPAHISCWPHFWWRQTKSDEISLYIVRSVYFHVGTHTVSLARQNSVSFLIRGTANILFLLSRPAVLCIFTTRIFSNETDIFEIYSSNSTFEDVVVSDILTRLPKRCLFERVFKVPGFVVFIRFYRTQVNSQNIKTCND